MTNPPGPAENGRLWLHELMYGTEVAQRLTANASAADMRQNGPKYVAVMTQLNALVSTEVVVVRQEEDGHEVAESGSVVGINLSAGSLVLRQGKHLKDHLYCRVEADDQQGNRIVPVVTLLAEQPYEY